jgi:hypothetical protein
LDLPPSTTLKAIDGYIAGQIRTIVSYVDRGGERDKRLKEEEEKSKKGVLTRWCIIRLCE